MKGFGYLVLIALVYLFIVIFLQDVSAEPRGVTADVPQSGSPSVPTCLDCQPENNDRIKGPSEFNPFNTPKEAIIGKGPGADANEADGLHTETVAGIPGFNGNEAKTPQVRAESQSQNVTNPFVDMFEVSDPATKNMLDAVYGSYSGDDQCRRKSFCMMGNYVKEMPGRDLFFMLLGGYIPPEYSLFYDIFRNSALYGQNCNVYVCIPSPTATPSHPLQEEAKKQGTPLAQSSKPPQPR